MKRSRRVVACSLVVLSAAIAAGEPSYAQTVPASTKTKRSTAKSQRPAIINTSEDVEVRAGIASANGVTNTTPGGGLMPPQTVARSQSAVTRDFIAKQAPTANVQSLIADLPGVVTASLDPLGITGDALSIRGFDQTQIGYLFEGAPVADPVNYEPYTNILVDSENIGSATVSQGSPDIDAPLYNAVGGQIKLAEIDPGHKFGGFFDLAGGTKSANKEFLRINTGDIGNSGVRGFVSLSHTGDNNFRGPGSLRRLHIDSKFIKEWGEDNSASLIIAYNRTRYNSFTNPSLAQWKQYGTSYNYDSVYTPGDTNYYGINVANNNALMLIAPVHLRLSDQLTFNTTPYLLQFWGPSIYGVSVPENDAYLGTQPTGPLGLPYATNGNLTTASTDPYFQRTAGLNSSLDWKTAHNDLTVGYWYAYTQHAEIQTFNLVDNNGGVSPNAIYTSDGSLLTSFNLNFKQQSNVLYLADTLKLLGNRLEISGGFKAAMVQRGSTNLLPGADPYRNYRDYFEPLPQFSVSYKLSPRDQIFMDATTSFRAPGSIEAYSQIFAPNSATAVEQPGTLRPEYTIGEEIGYRHTGAVNVSLALFNYNLTHHQVTSESYIGGTTQLVSEPLDVGGETKRGVQAEVSLPWRHHFSPYISGQYLYATTDNNYNAGSDYLPTAGKIAVESPRWTGAVGLNYDDGHFFGSFDIRYVDKQYSTFMNDQHLPSYIVSDIGVGYRLPTVGPAKHPQIQLNITNLGDNHYLSGVAGVGSNALATKGVFGSTVSASGPSYYVAGTFAALVSISSAF